MGIIKARIQNENGEYSWADIATSSEHTHKVQQLEDNSILATKADLGLQALVDENGNPITDEQGNQKYNSLAQIFHDWLSDIKKDQSDWKETNTASPNYIQNKPTTIIETINNMPPDEEGNVKVDILPAIGLGQDNFVLSAVRKDENTEEYQAEWKEIKVLPKFTQEDTDSVLTITNEENVPKTEWKKPNYDWNNISNKPNLINTLAEQDSINVDNLSEELIEKIENSGLEIKSGTTDPSVLTTGELGQIYVNITSNIGFICVKANENEYIWQAIGSNDFVQSNWNQTDAAQLDFIKNRPFGKLSALIENKELEFTTFTDTTGGYVEMEPIELIPGESYIVNFDENEYIYECKDGIDISLSIYYLGETTTNPFIIWVPYDYSLARIDTELPGDSHTISIIPVDTVKKLDEQYLPNIFVKSVNGETPDENGNIELAVSGGGSGQTGTIEQEKKIEWDTSNITVSFDIEPAGLSAYKISDTIISKEELLTAKVEGGILETEDILFSEDVTLEKILFDSESLLGFQLESNFAYVFCYQEGDIIVNYQGNDIPMTIPEVGFYQLNTYGVSLSNTLVGSLTYTEVTKVDFVQSDWNQTDYTKPDYIKNKPFGEFEISEMLIDGEYTATYNETNGLIPALIPITSDVHLTIGKKYIVIWNDEEYNVECITIAGMNGIGNPVLLGGEDNTLPFAIAEDLDGTFFGTSGFVATPAEITSATMTFDVKVIYEGTATKKIDTKYIYQSDWDENNPLSGSYIVNKPFGIISPGSIVADTSIYMHQDGENIYYATNVALNGNMFILGKIYTIVFNGITYENCICEYSDTYGCNGIISPEDEVALYEASTGFDVPMSLFTVYTTDSLNGVICNLKVVLAEEVIKKIDVKYLPDDIGSEAELPTVTTSDNGKFLRVVDGVWAVATVLNAEEAEF